MASFIRTDDHLTVVFDNGETVTVYPSNPKYTDIVAALKNKDYDTVRKLAVPALAVKAKIEKVNKRGVGSVQLRGGIVYYNDEPLHNTLTDRIIAMANEGFDIDPMLQFLTNLYQNPSYRAVTELYGFLEKGNLPITEDGHFLAYKRVRGDYTDCHTGKFSNAVGEVVKMERNKVNEDPNQTCSHGLHFCSRDYLQHFGNDTGNRTVILKINPADVVAIPADYNDTKGRCCRYEVIGELEHKNEAPLEGAFRPSDDYENEAEEEVTPNAPTPSDEYRIAALAEYGDVVREFDSIKEAAAWAGVTPSAIRRVLKGDRKTTGGYGWREEGVEAVDNTAAHPDHLKNQHNNGSLYGGKPHYSKSLDLDDIYGPEEDDDYEDNY